MSKTTSLTQAEQVRLLRHADAPNAKSQCGKIFALILSRYPDRVPLYEIFPLAKQYNARIFSLRRWLWPQGFDIECEEEWVDGQCHTWYRLINSPVVSASEPVKGEIVPADSAASKSDGLQTESSYMRRVRDEQAQAMPLFGARQ